MDYLEKLDKLYSLVKQTKKDSDFFYSLFNYIDYIDKTPFLVDIVTSVVFEKSKKDKEKLEILKKQVDADAKKTVTNIKTFLKRNKINHPDVMKRLEHAKGIFDGSITTSSGYTSSVFDAVNVLAARMYDHKDCKKFIKKYAVFDENNFISEWKWTEVRVAYNEEEQKIKRISPTRLWHHWDKLAFFHEIFENFEKHINEVYEQKKYMTILGMHEMHREIETVLKDGNVEKHYFFPPDKLRYSLEHFNLHFTSLVTEKLGVKDVSDKASYNKDNGKLTLKGQSVTFRKNTLRKSLLSLLFSNSSKEYSWDVVIAKIEGVEELDLRQKDKSKFYTACIGLNSRIANYLGVKDFLINNTQTVKINPKYI